MNKQHVLTRRRRRQQLLKSNQILFDRLTPDPSNYAAEVWDVWEFGQPMHRLTDAVRGRGSTTGPPVVAWTDCYIASLSHPAALPRQYLLHTPQIRVVSMTGMWTEPTAPRGQQLVVQLD